MLRSIIGSITTLAVVGVGGFLIWKYALNEPTNMGEAKEGLQNLGQQAGEQWDEMDLGNFTDVLDGLEGLDFGDLFNDDPKLGDNTTYLWQSDTACANSVCHVSSNAFNNFNCSPPLDGWI